MANRHPFWGAAKMIEIMHKDTMDALSNRPAGAAVRVYVLLKAFHYIIETHISGAIQTWAQGCAAHV